MTLFARKVALAVAAILGVLLLTELLNRSQSNLNQVTLKDIAPMDSLTDLDGANLRLAAGRRRNQAHLEFLKAVNTSRSINYAMANSPTHAWMDLFSVTYDCDNFDMKRLGVALPWDGGKLVCDDFKISAIDDCHVYSLGSNNDYSYEDALHKTYPNCKIDVFDCTIIPKAPEYVSFHKWCLGRYDTIQDGKQYKTLSTIMNLTQVDRVHIFKIDIEWNEWTTMPQLRQVEAHKLPVIVQIELHLNKGPWDNFQAAFDQVYEFQKLMIDLGYFLVAKERNNGNAACAEFVYYRP